VSDAILERQLVRAWQRGINGTLVTVDGTTVEVVFRGRCPGGAGPDVRNALVVFGGGQLLEGDVEFHRRTSDWFTHGHQGDARYRAVVLHVVLEHDADAPRDLTGHSVPTLVVATDELVEPTDHVSGLNPDECHRVARGRGADELGAILDGLGDRRLIQRAARFEADLTRLTPEALAYEALFDALGFSRNRGAFVRLAQTVPIELLLALVGRRPSAEALTIAEAILFGAAGLLPSQRHAVSVDWEADAAVEELESVWALYQSEWEGQHLVEGDWVFGGVRLPNYPTRRLATAARLVVRSREVGLDVAILAPLRAASATSSIDLERPYLVDEAASYWATHCDFGQPLPSHPAALLGRDRARDAVVNVTFPLALATAATNRDRALADAAWAAYRAFPRPAAYEATKRLAADLDLSGRPLSTARRQQGLLHLVRNHCERVACSTCPLNGENTHHRDTETPRTGERIPLSF
jgi:hypothetical protein